MAALFMFVVSNQFLGISDQVPSKRCEKERGQARLPDLRVSPLEHLALPESLSTCN
jgi:hypothetical protein